MEDPIRRRVALAAGAAVLLIGLGAALVVRNWAGESPGSWRSSAPQGSGGPGAGSPSAGPASASTSAACSAWGCEQDQRFVAAQHLIAGQAGTLGVVVRDRQTGTTWRGGTPSHVMWASSTVKLAMATSVLERARLGEVTVDATARRQIAAMLSVSDNAAATALWQRFGADAMVPRFQRVYGMTGLTFVPGFERTWGFLKCSAEDLQRLVTYVVETLNPADRAVIMDGMRTVGPIQRWGVFAAGQRWSPGTKNGWSIEVDNGVRHWCTSTAGFVGPEARFVVSAMYDQPAGGTVDRGVHAISDLVATVFGAPVPAQVTVPDPSTGW